MMVAPHMGNWEVAGAVAESLNLRVLSVAEDLPNKRITDWFIKTRAAFGIDILVHGRGSTMAALTKALKGGQVVALVADRDVNGRGVPVEFFGEMTTMPAGPYSLVELTGSTTSACTSARGRVSFASSKPRLCSTSCGMLIWQPRSRMTLRTPMALRRSA